MIKIQAHYSVLFIFGMFGNSHNTIFKNNFFFKKKRLSDTTLIKKTHNSSKKNKFKKSTIKSKSQSSERAYN